MGKLFLGVGITNKMNIEHRTSNIERWMGKNEETDIWSGKATVLRIASNFFTTKNRPRAIDAERSIFEIFLFDVERSMFDVGRSSFNTTRQGEIYLILIWSSGYEIEPVYAFLFSGLTPHLRFPKLPDNW